MKLLEGKVAVVTGASRGLGRAIAEAFAAEGAMVVLAARSAKEIERLAEELRAKGAEAAAFPCDVTDGKQVEALARFAAERPGGFDVWVNNAGVGGPYGATLDLSSEDFLRVLETNVLGAYQGSVAAMRHFIPRGRGKLINILGAGDRGPVPNQNAYGSSKSWIRSFTLALGKEYADSGVGVFALQPGLMDTDLLKDVETYPAYQKKLEFMPFLIRAIGKRPEVAAKEVLRLASSATDGRTALYVSLGSRLGSFAGFAREGLRQAFKLPARKVEMRVKLKEPAFKPLP
jgi:glucose 1-dehydrogenase